MSFLTSFKVFFFDFIKVNYIFSGKITLKFLRITFRAVYETHKKILQNTVIHEILNRIYKVKLYIALSILKPLLIAKRYHKTTCSTMFGYVQNLF